MLYALDLTTVFRIVSLVTLVAAVGVVGLTDPRAAHDLWSAKSWVLAAPSGLIFLLTFRPIFRWVHRCTFARYWLFPLLDGDWTGDISSNWARIETTMRAARGDAPPFNVQTDPLPAGSNPTIIPIRATIESGLLSYKLNLKISATRRSYSIFVRPQWRRPDPPRLYYLYRQQEDAHVPVTDTRRHLGAGYVEFDESEGTLSGEYWTQRQSELGLNTAGTIRLKRRLSRAASR